MIHIKLTGLVRPKKNSRRMIFNGRKPILLPSENFVSWHADAMKQLATQNSPKDKISTPVSVAISFAFKDKRRRDLTNLSESVMDLIVDYGVIKDDCWQICRKVAMNGYESISDEVYVEITQY
jgi:Holliday junction resolvase RusA-like endonuclease